jgi:outer membrane protein assembly factor BamA
MQGVVRVAFVLVAVLAVLCQEASAQPVTPEAAVGRPVRAVTVAAAGRPVDAPSIPPLIDTKVGAPLDVAQVRSTLRTLVALDRFDDITVRAEPLGDGIALVYDVRLTRRVERVEFRGDRGLSPRHLRGLLSERFGDRQITARQAGEMAGVLDEALRQAGFLDARVTWQLEPGARADVATLVFDIVAGTQARIGAVVVAGEPLEGEARLVRRLGLTPGTAWREAATRERADREVRRWREKGRYQAHIDLVTQRRAGEAVVDLRVDASPGPHIELVFEGDPLPKSLIADLVPVEREGAVDEDLLEDSKRRLERYLRSQGYWRASVEYRRSGSPAQSRIVFDVRRGLPYEVGEIEIEGVRSLPRDTVGALLTVTPGLSFVEDELSRDVQVIARHFHEQGYAAAKVSPDVTDAGRDARSGSAARGRVRIRITVDEGPRTLVGAIRIEGHQALDEAALRQVMRLRPGEPFFAPSLVADRAAVEAVYVGAGFADTRVTVAAEPAPEPGRADITYRVVEGERSVVQHVIVTGNERTSADTILREARIRTGQALAAQDLTDAQRRLAALGLFRRVRIDVVREPGSPARNVVIAVEEAPVTSVGYGAGIEGGRRLRREDAESSAVERFEFAPRGFFEVGRRNLWGKNRSVTLFSRASLRQNPGTAEDPDPGGYGIYEYRVLGTYREPRAFGWNADATVSGLFEQAIRTSFSYRRRALNADLTRRFARSVTVAARYSAGYTDVYEDRSAPEDAPLIDRLFPQVRLSTVSGFLAWDTRDDVIEPTRGHSMALQVDVAARSIGSEVGFAKSFSQVFVYRKLGASRVVFAGGARLGLATGFPRQVPAVDEDGNPVLDEDGNQVVQTVKDLPSSERFYAGGDTTVRGYTLDRLGDDDTIDQDGFPLGGDAVVIFNGELRFPVTSTLGGVVFVDSGNVFSRVSNFDLARIKATTGVGVRYKSPIGPLRVDLGVKLDPRTFADGSRERGYEFHISVGQAF